MYALYIEVSSARMQQMQLVSQKNIEMTLQTAEKLCSDQQFKKLEKLICLLYSHRWLVFSKNKQIEDQFWILSQWDNKKLDIRLFRMTLSVA